MEVKLNGVVIPPASGPPSGPAGGALAGTYPDPALNTANTAGDAVLKGTLTTAGDLIGASAANTPARVVPQAAGTVLTSNGVGVAATFQAAGAGTAIPKSILTAVGDIVSASGVATPAVIPATTAGLILTANGAGVQSTYQTNPAIASAAAAQTTANAAVAKSTATTTGDLYAASAPSTPTRIAGGAVGEVLTGNGAGVLPSFQAAGSGTAIPKSVLTAVGDLVSASAAGTPAVIPAVAAGRILRAAGAATVPAYSTLTVPDTAARGTVLVATGANTVTALAMQAVNTFGGGDGTDFVARTAAQVLAATDGARTTTWDFTTSTGWTLVNGNGSATIGAGLLTLTTATGISTAAPNAPTGTVAIPANVDPWRGLDLSVRLATLATSGGGLPTGSVVAWISISNKTDGKNGTYAGTDMGVVVTVNPDGTVNAGDFTPTFNSRGSSAAGVVLRDGQDWLRLMFDGGDYEVYAGRGVTRPTTWVRTYSGTLGAVLSGTATFAQSLNITLSGYRNSTTAENIVIAWGDLAITALL